MKIIFSVGCIIITTICSTYILQSMQELIASLVSSIVFHIWESIVGLSIILSMCIFLTYQTSIHTAKNDLLGFQHFPALFTIVVLLVGCKEIPHSYTLFFLGENHFLPTTLPPTIPNEVICKTLDGGFKKRETLDGFIGPLLEFPQEDPIYRLCPTHIWDMPAFPFRVRKKTHSVCWKLIEPIEQVLLKWKGWCLSYVPIEQRQVPLVEKYCLYCHDQSMLLVCTLYC